MQKHSTFSLLPLLALFLVSGSSFAQSATEKLQEAYGSERAKELEKEHPRIYAYHLYEVEHSYKLIPTRKGKSYQELKEVPYYGKQEDERKIPAEELLEKVKNGSFNPMKCRLQRKKSAPTLYELKGTGKVLLFLSEDELAQKFNAQR